MGRQNSKFQNDMAALFALRCQKCWGDGQYDDAEPGDISFRWFPCGQCSGTGYEPKDTPTGKNSKQS